MSTISKSDFDHHRVVSETGDYKVKGRWYEVSYTQERGEDYLVIRVEVKGNGITEDTTMHQQLILERNSDGLWDACRFKDFQAVTDYFNDIIEEREEEIA